MTRMLKRFAACGLVMVLASGCLLKETSETWYLGPDGEVTWVVTERDVRSDANTTADRQEEESHYWLAVQQQRHPMANGFQELGGTKIRTLVLRSESPYTVQTDARFTGLDAIGRRLIAATGMLGTSIVTREGPAWEWKLVVRDPASMMSHDEPSENVSALMNDLDSLRVVLLQGRFDSADGFDLSNDRRVATLTALHDSKDRPEEPTVTLRLKWQR